MVVGILAILFLTAQEPGPAVDWRAELENGRQAWAKRDYAAAVTSLNAAVEAAGTVPDAAASVREALRLLAGAYRVQGDQVQAERVLLRVVELDGAKPGLETAATLAELAAVQRAQGRADAALASIERAITIRETKPEGKREDLARDLTTAAVLQLQAGATDPGVERLKRALDEWDAAAPTDPRSLPALEALAGVHRDRNQYADAEPLLVRALRLREATASPESAEVISAVDSLAYVKFGLRKMPEAETLFQRLLALWEKNAGPDHPMVALTLDKLAEFYAFQQRYDQAEVFARRALALRTRIHVASLNQTGRILLMQAKLDQAEDLYRRTIQIGDLAEAPDEALDPPLRIYAQVLRELKRPEEAATLDKRVKDALIRKADREGRLEPPPVKP